MFLFLILNVSCAVHCSTDLKNIYRYFSKTTQCRLLKYKIHCTPDIRFWWVHSVFNQSQNRLFDFLYTLFRRLWWWRCNWRGSVPFFNFHVYFCPKVSSFLRATASQLSASAVRQKDLMWEGEENLGSGWNTLGTLDWSGHSKETILTEIGLKRTVLRMCLQIWLMLQTPHPWQTNNCPANSDMTHNVHSTNCPFLPELQSYSASLCNCNFS